MHLTSHLILFKVMSILPELKSLQHHQFKAEIKKNRLLCPLIAFALRPSPFHDLATANLKCIHLSFLSVLMETISSYPVIYLCCVVNVY